MLHFPTCLYIEWQIVVARQACQITITQLRFRWVAPLALDHLRPTGWCDMIWRHVGESECDSGTPLLSAAIRESRFKWFKDFQAAKDRTKRWPRGPELNGIWWELNLDNLGPSWHFFSILSHRIPWGAGEVSIPWVLSTLAGHAGHGSNPIMHFDSGVMSYRNHEASLI